MTMYEYLQMSGKKMISGWRLSAYLFLFLKRPVGIQKIIDVRGGHDVGGLMDKFW